MNNRYIITLLIALGFTSFVYAQEGFLVTGKIIDSLNKEAVNGATVKVKGTKKLAIATADGSFQLKVLQKLPIITKFSLCPKGEQ